MYKLIQLCLVLCLTASICHATTLIQSTDRLILGNEHILTCIINGAYFGLLFISNDSEICIFDDKCTFIRCNDRFRYACDINTRNFTLTFPGSFTDDSYHHSSWQCEDFLSTKSNKVFLYITVPVSSVNITQNITDIAVGNSHVLTCKTSAGRPNAKIQWYLSDGTNLTTIATQQPDCGQCINLVESISSVTYIGKLSDHGKSIYCVASNSEGIAERSRNVIIRILYGPTSVVLSPFTASYIVSESTGSIGPIICTADCRPNCTMAWRGPYLPGGMKSVLNLNNIHRNQTGDYRCTASNSVGSLTSEKVTIIVNYGPSYVLLSPSTSSYTVNETTGSIGPITCTADCRPYCTMKWGGPNLPVGTPSILNLQNINRNQTGSYKCTANNSVSSLTSGKVTVIVNYRPGIVMLIPQTSLYTVNETSEIGPITCTADCRPICRMTWNGPNLPGGTSVMNLQNINKNQAGNYRCTAKNSIGNNTSAVVTIVVYYGPNYVVLSPSTPSYTVTETTGSVGPITCTADCKPDCTVSWNGPNIPGVKTSVLYLQNISRNQSGNYMCTAKNFLQSNNSRILAVIVNYGPSSIVVSPSTPSYTVTESTGSIGPIKCTADCRPICAIAWNGPNLPGGTASVLNIQNVSRIQSGDYQCTAKNSIGSRTSGLVAVIINYDPTILSIEGNTTYYVNDTAEFRCLVDSFPESLIQWTFIDGNYATIISKDNKSFYKVNGSVLKVYSMSCLSMGSYSCEAANSIGTTQKSVNVTVMCSARLNTIENEILYKIVVRENESLNITVPILAYPTPWLSWQYQKNQYFTNITNEVTNRHYINRHTSSLFIQNMEEENFGTYVIYGSNGIDNANQIGSFNVVEAPNRPSTADSSSSPSFPVGFGTGFGVAVIICIVIVVITALVRKKRKRKSRPTSSNLYEETGCKSEPANIYNELNQNTKDGKNELLTRRNKTDIPNMYDDSMAYDNQVIINEDQKGQRKGSTSTKIGGGIYMNTEI